MSSLMSLHLGKMTGLPWVGDIHADSTKTYLEQSPWFLESQLSWIEDKAVKGQKKFYISYFRLSKSGYSYKLISESPTAPSPSAGAIH